ncbi:hypothetical protein [Variovorax sp. J22R115]|uniref:hypothetical protein n=1 Tax=Variovorax sp. J22R115 TaxID=3053509 RepID=UPI002574F756|nr:hypothetical protein [Variovorax sp. J22R115]MDM0049725.1 hypothetical protein [Variovorax sp. J22R115]
MFRDKGAIAVVLRTLPITPSFQFVVGQAQHLGFRADFAGARASEVARHGAVNEADECEGRL